VGLDLVLEVQDLEQEGLDLEEVPELVGLDLVLEVLDLEQEG